MFDVIVVVFVIVIVVVLFEILIRANARSKRNNESCITLRDVSIITNTEIESMSGEIVKLRGVLQDICPHERVKFSLHSFVNGRHLVHKKTCKACGDVKFIEESEYEAGIKQQELDSIEADRDALEARQKAVMAYGK